MVRSDPQLSETIISTGVKPAFCLRRAGSSASTTAGSMVLHPSSLFPPLEWCENQNLFQHFLELSSILMATLMSDPFCRLSFPGASISRRISSTDYLMLITSLP